MRWREKERTVRKREKRRKRARKHGRRIYIVTRGASPRRRKAQEATTTRFRHDETAREDEDLVRARASVATKKARSLAIVATARGAGKRAGGEARSKLKS